MAAEFTVSAEVPEDVSVTDSVEAALTVTLPKGRLAALTVNFGFVAAVSSSCSSATVVVLPVVELLLIVTWPETAPVAVGLNCTVNVAD